MLLSLYNLVTRARNRELNMKNLDTKQFIVLARNLPLDRYLLEKSRKICARRRSVAPSILKVVTDMPQAGPRARARSQPGVAVTSSNSPSVQQPIDHLNNSSDMDLEMDTDQLNPTASSTPSVRQSALISVFESRRSPGPSNSRQMTTQVSFSVSSQSSAPSTSISQTPRPHPVAQMIPSLPTGRLNYSSNDTNQLNVTASSTPSVKRPIPALIPLSRSAQTSARNALSEINEINDDQDDGAEGNEPKGQTAFPGNIKKKRRLSFFDRGEMDAYVQKFKPNAAAHFQSNR